MVSARFSSASFSSANSLKVDIDETSRRSRTGLAKTFGSAMRACSSLARRRASAQREALLAASSSVPELEAKRRLARAGSELEPVAQARLDGAPLALRARNNAAYTEVRGEGILVLIWYHTVAVGRGSPRTTMDEKCRYFTSLADFSGGAQGVRPNTLPRLVR